MKPRKHAPNNVQKINHSIDEATAMAGWGRTMTYQLIAEGRLKSIKVGRRRLIPHAALLECQEQLERESNSK